MLSAEIRRSAPLFAALGDETRLGLVARLSGGEPLSITSLAAGTEVTRQAITKHLHVLKGAGLVEGKKRGRERMWRLLPEQLDEARRAIDAISRQWDAALLRLKESIENP